MHSRELLCTAERPGASLAARDRRKFKTADNRLDRVEGATESWVVAALVIGLC